MSVRKTSLIGIILVLLILISVYSIMFKNILYIKRETKRRPNILLVTIDSLRQDHLGCYGYQRNTSPNIDKLAKTSTLFKSCYTPIPWTTPAVIALMTGKYPIQYGDVGGETVLPEVLQSISYLTYGIIGTDMVRMMKINRGFNIFLDNSDLKTRKDGGSVDADVIVQKAIEFLNQQQTKRSPIFLWLFFKDPHWKYLPPPPYNEKFLNDSLSNQQHQKLTINEGENDSIGGIGEARLEDPNGQFITDKAYYISQYDAEILYMDEQFGKIIEYLKEARVFDDWMIIFLSDHGESLGEDQYFFDHGYTLSEATVKIPLLIKFPGQRKAKVIYGLVSTCDIYPTIAELAGLDITVFNTDSHGRSLSDKKGWLKIIQGKDRKIILENSPIHEKGNVKLVGCILSQYKLIWNLKNNEQKLYKISKQEILLDNKYKIMLIDKMTNIVAKFFIKKGKLDFITSEEVKRLRSLGYIQ